MIICKVRINKLKLGWRFQAGARSGAVPGVKYDASKKAWFCELKNVCALWQSLQDHEVKISSSRARTQRRRRNLFAEWGQNRERARLLAAQTAPPPFFLLIACRPRSSRLHFFFFLFRLNHFNKSRDLNGFPTRSFSRSRGKLLSCKNH